MKNTISQKINISIYVNFSKIERSGHELEGPWKYDMYQSLSEFRLEAD